MEIFRTDYKKVQYRGFLPIAGAVQETSRTKLYVELGLSSLIKRRWWNKLTKIVKSLLSPYSYLDFPSEIKYSLTSASASVLKPVLSRTQFFENSFFWYCINQWNIVQLKLQSLNQLVL